MSEALHVRNGSDSVIRRFRLNVRFAESGHGWAFYEYTPWTKVKPRPVG